MYHFHHGPKSYGGGDNTESMFNGGMSDGEYAQSGRAKSMPSTSRNGVNDNKVRATGSAGKNISKLSTTNKSTPPNL